MRHGDKINNLGRTASHRNALLTNLACQLFEHKKIVTTLAKAKALRPFVEPLITKSKENSTHQRRLVFSRLQDKAAVKELFDAISPKIAGRPGGYTRIIKLGKRVGDNAELAMIELVDYNEIYGKGIGEKEAAGAKRTRRAGRSKKAAEAKPATEAQLPEVRPEELPEVQPEELPIPATDVAEAEKAIAPEEKPEQPDSDVKA
jgi:large subunit ribosomal protein L17